MTARLLLASRSATRRLMLDAAGVPFASVNAPFDEENQKQRLRRAGADAPAVASGLAEAKALSVTAPGAYVLGADQTLELDDGTMLDKPRSREELAEQLARMSGRPHRLHAAAAIAFDGAVVWRGAESVTMHVRPLTPAFITAYLEAEYEAVRWNVGGYRIEGPGAQLFARIDGSHFAILGLPLLPLLGWLRERALLPT